ncbi:MAG: FAD-binding oxidoreductase, partial [Deltaproteobacteria bacterium]|nr:FAD-binding oxidoreductase [Deltaproteobacteria bacterium]
MDAQLTLKSEQREFLQRLFPGGLLTSSEDMLVYSSDASLRRGTPLAVVKPENVEQAQEFMRWADAERMPVYIRGFGTNLVGDCVPLTPGVVLSTLKMNRILEISESDFVAVVEPGVNTSEFQDACEAKGLFYPPDPATVKACSLGGNVVTGAGGMRALKYGVTRDFVLGVEVILPGGDKVMFGGRNHKNVVGLDLARLMVG